MKIFLSLIVSYVLLFSVAGAVEPFPFESLLGREHLGHNIPPGYEPSGVVWNSHTERFFVVDDDGQLSTMDVDGNNVGHLGGASGDLEGVTIADPTTDYVYIGREGSNEIVELAPPSHHRRTFDLSPWMPVAGNSSLEALTFVADPDDPEGGLFYAGQQSNGVIYAFRLPIASSTTSTAVEFQFSFQAAPGRADLSGMHYDAANDVLYAIWDSSDLLRAMRPDGTFLQEWNLPGFDQEGITFQDSNLVIAQDSGAIIRYPDFPMFTPEPTSLALCFCGIALLVSKRCRRRSR